MGKIPRKYEISNSNFKFLKLFSYLPATAMNIVYQHQRLAVQKMRKERNVRNWSGNQTKGQMQDGIVIVEMLTKRTLNLAPCVKLCMLEFPF